MVVRVCAYCGRSDHITVRESLSESLPRHGLNETYLIGIPAITTTIAFFVPVLLIKPAGICQTCRCIFSQTADSDRYGNGTWNGRSLGPRTISAGRKSYDRNGPGVLSTGAASSPGRDR
jgi:hypothetical protein